MPDIQNTSDPRLLKALLREGKARLRLVVIAGSKPTAIPGYAHISASLWLYSTSENMVDILFAAKETVEVKISVETDACA